MDNNDSNLKSQQTGGLKLMTVFIAVLALHVVVIGGFTVYHLMSGGNTDADIVTLDKAHLKADASMAVAGTVPDTTTSDKPATSAPTPASSTDTATTAPGGCSRAGRDRCDRLERSGGSDACSRPRADAGTGADRAGVDDVCSDDGGSVECLREQRAVGSVGSDDIPAHPAGIGSSLRCRVSSRDDNDAGFCRDTGARCGCADIVTGRCFGSGPYACDSRGARLLAHRDAGNLHGEDHRLL